MWNAWEEGEIPLPFAPDSALVPIYPRPDLLDAEHSADLSDTDEAHREDVNGQPADILTQIAGAARDTD